MTALLNRNDLAEELSCLQNDDKDTLPVYTENMNLSYKNTYNVFKNVNGLKFMHINITTLLPKIDDIKHLLIDLKVDIISLNETRLDKRINDACLNIDGYSLL